MAVFYKRILVGNFNDHNFLIWEAILTNHSIFERTDWGLQFRFSNVLEIISANAISTQLFFTRGFYLEIEISITCLCEKQFKQMGQFSKELNEV